MAGAYESTQPGISTFRIRAHFFFFHFFFFVFGLFIFGSSPPLFVRGVRLVRFQRKAARLETERCPIPRPCHTVPRVILIFA